MPGYRVDNFNLSGSYGVSLEIQRKNKKSYHLINIEADAIGYGVIEERQSVGASSFFQKGLVKRRMSIMNPIIRGAFLYKLPLLNELVYKDSKNFFAKPYLTLGGSLDYGMFDYEANTFEGYNVRDTLFSLARANLSIWVGTHFRFFYKQKNILDLQIHFKQGLIRQFSISRYDIITRDVQQMIDCNGSSLTISIAKPIRLGRKSEKE
jgi:hypothetical protein